MNTDQKKLTEANLTVGYVAKRSGVKVSTLHFYETKQLIRSWRNTGNQRRYKPDVLRRVAVIKAAQAMGITLDEIKNTLATLPDNRTPTKQDWSALSKQWQAQLDERIAYMQGIRDKVNDCIGCGCLSLKSCPIYNKDDFLGDSQSGAVLLGKLNK
ncbi:MULTISPECIES: redox-sensitive transcriptional activator SoxR [Pseudoalteromonas]|uniref:Redox-sensitive transcriptional activator SoxR n=1 Tax=Pseudoalteromonas aliena SW19 TaxID=1314866 RepID=A0ABR9E1E2_9GAMM|nr:MULTISPECIES: redox-sensitive transcriptional activator SoxR [Pseudoalteromonas]MBB1384091.1 redox-sensitive transcriptional activator SoxR [Pseudoalteromonas sp. SG45-5]MBB1392203.1 redox-sensitive transcriptional activator SoxR [Pseudoalteromonas sp. SG44-4]MBB1448051.1 redox-sensitive transcriptional activator SoxR [Pseudoalteromonas sp. SG41-6]MBE0359259.1 MerR family transcriptional regulator, redox-sensitive transcriptional activator SoxR [Pseudoalteromonas aliena SW19]TMO08580.1 redo